MAFCSLVPVVKLRHREAVRGMMKERDDKKREERLQCASDMEVFWTFNPFCKRIFACMIDEEIACR